MRKKDEEETKMSRSIIQDKKEGRCYICGEYCSRLEEHHVFGGGCRKLSEHYGLKVYLCHLCHNEPPKGVHFNREEREKLQATVQKIAMKHYGWTKQIFIKIFGRNYILEEEK